ncbi:MAG TPA: HAMP domain-containing sensor histidine kinase [Balneolales bacterium]|nr:HAMP domain-containing sensor histidine kinase [Balneolales bacterium]
MKKYTSFRKILFSIGLLAIIGLTGMNVYSLYKLNKTSIATSVENKKNQISEFASQVRNRFLVVSKGIWKIDTDKLNNELEKGKFPASFMQVLTTASQDSLFSQIYFARPDQASATKSSFIYKYNTVTNKMMLTRHYPELVHDGIELAQTRMKVLAKDYQWPTKTLFDTNRSMTITLINPKNHSIMGYVCLVIDNNYLIHGYLQPMLIKTFGKNDPNGITVWVHDWVKNKDLATNNPNVSYNKKKVHINDSFPGLLDNWNLKAAFDELPTVNASRAQFERNLTALGAAVLILLGSLVFINITAQKERELALRQTGFLANVTHELKTPLAVMQAAGENLADGRVKDPDRLKTYGKHIYNESVRLRKMIEKLLDVAKTDAGQMILKPSQQQLDLLVANFVEEHRSYLENKGFTLKTNIDKNIPPVEIDPGSFQTILDNLVENAIKYSPNEKFIGIYVRNQKTDVVVEVEDHGLGIPFKAQKHIFDKFFRVEDTLTAHTKGHGLGLSIVKSLVELNHGDIILKSQYRKGSKFIVHFPAMTDEKIRKMSSIQKKSIQALTNEGNTNYVVQG